MLIISDKQTCYRSKTGETLARVDNFLVLAPVGGRTQVIAVGGPSQWHSTAPLPPEAIVKDLVAAALENCGTASELWDDFLAYVIHKAVRGKRRAFFADLYT